MRCISTHPRSPSRPRRARRTRLDGLLPAPPRRGPATVRLASITDGTSNTLAFGERAHGLLSKADKSFSKWHWWISGNYGDTAFTTYYPPNIQKENQSFAKVTEGGGVRERRVELPPRRRELRDVRRLGPVPQGLDQ